VDPGAPPDFLDELTTLYGHQTRDRGTMLSAGGHRERTPPRMTEATPAAMSQDFVAGSSVGQSSKRRTRDQVVDSPQKKKSASLEDCVRDISDTVKEMASGGQQLSREEKEMDQVRQILEQDGFPEGTEEFLRATYLCRKKLNRRTFLTMKTREGRLTWITFNWENK